MSTVATPVSSAALRAAITEAQVTHVVTVPDTHQRSLLQSVTDDPSCPLIRAATEDDVIGICTGLWMSGQRPLALIQQLGLFAAANTLRWVAHDVRTPLPILAGLYGRDVDVPVAEDPASAVRLCPPLLEALEIRCEIIDGPAQLIEVAPAIRQAFEERSVRVVPLGGADHMSTTLTDAEAVRCIARERDDRFLILTMSGLAFWPSPGEREFRLVGLMGAAASLGLGIALGAPDVDVWVVDGDGSALMRLGVMPAVAAAAPRRFTHIVLANGVYSVSGGQPVPGRPDWEALGRGAGYRAQTRCTTAGEIRTALRRAEPGPRLVVVECERDGGGFAPGALSSVVSEEATRLRTILTSRLAV